MLEGPHASTDDRPVEQVPTSPAPEEVRNEQVNDTPADQEALTGESITTPEDTQGG